VVSLYQRRECGASLIVQEYAGEKKIDMGKNLEPKHCPNQ